MTEDLDSVVTSRLQRKLQKLYSKETMEFLHALMQWLLERLSNVFLFCSWCRNPTYYGMPSLSFTGRQCRVREEKDAKDTSYQLQQIAFLTWWLMRGLTITPCTMPPHLMIMKLLCLWFTSLSEHLWNLFLQAVLKYCFRTWKHCIAVHTFHLLLDCTNHRKIASLKNSTEGADHSLRVFSGILLKEHK